MQSLKSGDEQELRRMREQLEALQARPKPPCLFKLPLCASLWFRTHLQRLELCGFGCTCSATASLSCLFESMCLYVPK